MLFRSMKWKNLLKQELEKEYYLGIGSYLQKEMLAGKVIYPVEKNIFRAFDLTAPDEVKIVILGQDPYHGPGQAHGLSFSVERDVKIPPSLRNIYKEIASEYPGWDIPSDGNLSHWAEQGILMLNSILTVEATKAASHRKIGWESFTDAVISEISDSCDGVIFLLWGNFARSKKVLIDNEKHFILESAHPSPLSAYQGFFGNGHFREVNRILLSLGKREIIW